MRIGIVGSREFKDLEKVREFVRGLNNDDVVVSGGCRGVDRIGVEEGRKCGLKCVELKYKGEFGKSGGMVRNRELVMEIDRCVVFWDGSSRGSEDMIKLCKVNGVKIEIVREENDCQLSLW